jgi:Protein of unknown function (DUF2800)
MPSEHAPLGPSSASRWLVCTASVRLVNEVAGYQDSVYAREGTLAHTRAEIEARVALGLATAKEMAPAIRKFLAACTAGDLTEEQIEDIITHADGYADLLVKRREEMGPGTVVFLEERVYPDVPQCWGTGDAVLVSSTEIDIIDFKYGAGVRVYADDNPQLKLYGLGALEGFGDIVGDTELIRTTIYQPRVNAEPVWADWTPAELRQWRADVVRPKAAEALSEEGVFTPGESQCRWCPAAGICRARMKAAIDEDFSSDPDIISDDELADLLERLPGIEAWAKSVREVAFRKVYEMKHKIGDWKIVKTEGKRSITDVGVATERLLAAGYAEEDVTRRQAQTLGRLEKLVGKNELPEILGDVLKKGEGSLVLTPGSDPRPAHDPISAAQADFKEE